MRIAVVRTYDVSAFDEKLKNIIENMIVIMLIHIQQYLIKMNFGIAIIFYRSRMGDTNENN